jgi:hypothetical protein
MLKFVELKKKRGARRYLREEKTIVIVVDSTSTNGVSLRTPLPAALAAALTKLLGSSSAEIHSTHTATNNVFFFLVHARSSG